MYATISQGKISNLQGTLIHNQRKRKKLNNVDYSRTNENITIVNFGYKNQNDFLEKKKFQIREYNLKKGSKHRMIQKNKSFCQELIFSHSHNALSKSQSIEYCKLAHQFIKDRFKDNEILNSVIHLDEKTPHIHIVVSYFDITNCKFNQKDLMKKKLTDIDKIRDDFDKYIKPFFPTLKKQDGSVVTNHNKKASLEIDKLKKENKLLKDEINDLKKQIDDLKNGNKIDLDLDDLIKESEKNLNETKKITTRTRKRRH